MAGYVLRHLRREHDHLSLLRRLLDVCGGEGMADHDVDRQLLDRDILELGMQVFRFLHGVLEKLLVLGLLRLSIGDGLHESATIIAILPLRSPLLLGSRCSLRQDPTHSPLETIRCASCGG